MKIEIDSRAFTNYPKDSSCFFCGTNDDLPCVLIPVDGTQRENIEQAEPVHIRCLADSKNWRMNRNMGIIYGRIIGDKL
jgi:hypothetical protein